MSEDHTEKTPREQSAPGIPHSPQKAPDNSNGGATGAPSAPQAASPPNRNPFSTQASQAAPIPSRNPFSTQAEQAPNANDAPHIPDSYEVRNLGFMTVITGRNIPGVREMIAAYKEAEARNASRNAPRPNQQQPPAAGDGNGNGTAPDAGEANDAAKK